MKVHIVMRHIQYEGDSIEGVYQDAFHALRVVAELTKNERHTDVRYSSSAHHVHIDEDANKVVEMVESRCICQGFFKPHWCPVHGGKDQ